MLSDEYDKINLVSYKRTKDSKAIQYNANRKESLMAYSVNNTDYQNLMDEEREVIGLDSDERENVVAEVLNSLDGKEILGMCRDYNNWDGSFEFADTWDAEEFLTIMTECKRGQKLVDFILEVANAVAEYDGNDIFNACWGYPNGYDIEIRDEKDVISDAVDHVADLAWKIVSDGTSVKVDDMPVEIMSFLELWESEDRGEFAD